MSSSRILYLGVPVGALLLRRDGHRLVAACISRPSFPGMRRVRAALAADGAPVFARPDLDDPGLLGILRSAKPSLVVSFFWHRRVPAAVRALAPLGAIGVHPSLLPRHRGADPIFWALRRGDIVTGATVHALDDGYDTGPIHAARTLAIDPSWNAHRLAHALDACALETLREVCLTLARGDAPPPRPQDPEHATAAPEPTEDDLEIRWSMPSEEILRLVRAAAPAPGAFSSFEDRALTVIAASATTTRLPPGAAAITRGGVIVGTGDVAVRLDCVRVEDGDELLRGEAVADAVPGASDLRGTP